MAHTATLGAPIGLRDIQPRTDWSLLPDYMHGGVERYVMQGVKPGDFLTAIFSNDFMEATGRADDNNRVRLFQYAIFLYNYCPAQCYGSPEKVAAWIKGGGYLGLRRAAQDA